jgi:Cytochrome c554 and c-prime
MRTDKRPAVFLLMIVFSLVTFTGLFFTIQATIIPDKSSDFLPSGYNISAQEIVKYRYVGMEKCASVCHNNEEMGFQYDIMKNSPHSNAFKILLSVKATRYAKKVNVKENPQESAICLKCHTTGAGLDSSFFASTYKKEDGVTCEACHKGAFITKTFIPKEEDCLKCHNDSLHKMRHFNFMDNCAKITHPRPKGKVK